MNNKLKNTRDEIVRISGVNPKKCMKCGKCTATCPAFDEMEYHPHQFVNMVESGDRCPRGVEPAKLVEAVRLTVIRQKGGNHLKTDDIPALLDENIPQQALVSALRKYAK